MRGVRLQRFWLEHPARFFALAFAVLLLLGLAERGLSYLVAPFRDPALGACWIWARGTAATGEPVAFYAVRDFELEAPRPIALSIVADESYVAYLNGEYVGSGAYRGPGPVDRYQVGELLVAGRNRLVVELRSGRGAGGFLATLAVDEGRVPFLVTDGDWRIIRRPDRGVFRLSDPLPDGEPPQLWQRPPTGRWRIAPAAGDRPILKRGEKPPVRLYPLRARPAEPGALWLPVERRPRFPLPGPRVLIDWGREVTGFLYFDLPSADAEPALAYFGGEPPDPGARPPDEVLIFMPGVPAWRDVHPRTFRYVLLIGVAPADKVWVRELAPKLAEQLSPRPPSSSGVFGVQPPLRRSPAEERIWERVLGAP